MRICIHKATKRIVEMQGGEDDRPDLSEMRLDTLKRNALNAGYAEADIEVKWVDDAGYEAAKAIDPVEQASIKEREEQQVIDSLINQKMKDLAIAELKKEGKLDAHGKIPK